MRLRFTIRDLLWLTLVVALTAGWWFDHARSEQIAEANFQAVMKLVDRTAARDSGPLPSLPQLYDWKQIASAQ
jgi:hypothetical protein